ALGMLEDAERAAIIHEVGRDRFTFDHAIVRAALLEGLGGTRRALTHRQIAEAIERMRPTDHDELAHHWMLAGADDRAQTHIELAARRDLDALAFESAADRYETILQHLESRDPQERDPAIHAMTARAWLGLGLARRALGESDFITAIRQAGRRARML